MDLAHRRGGGRRSYTRPARGRTTTPSRRRLPGGQAESRYGRGTDGPRRPGRMCDRQGLSLTGGLKGSSDMTAPGRRGSPSPRHQRFCALARRGAAPDAVTGTTPGPGCYRTPQWPRKPSSCRRDRRALALRTTSIRRHAPDMAARARERAQAIPAPCRRPQSESPDAWQILIGAGTPQEAVAGGYGCICVLIARSWSRSRSLRPRSSRRMLANRLIDVSPSSETRWQ